MNEQERAALVAAYRVEIKQSANMRSYLDAQTYSEQPLNSRQRMEAGRARSRRQRPLRGEDANQYIVRTAEGGDESYGRAAARWDLRRLRGTRPAAAWDDGYTSYDGWANRARQRASRRPR